VEDIEFIDTVAGRPVKVSLRLLRRIVTTEVSNTFYWMYSPIYFWPVKRFVVDLKMDESKLDPETAKMVRRYVLHYAENLVLSNYIHIKAVKGAKEAKRYLDYMMPLLQKLRELYSSGSKIWDMVKICLDYGIDPF